MAAADIAVFLPGVRNLLSAFFAGRLSDKGQLPETFRADEFSFGQHNIAAYRAAARK